jgi:capsid protein
MLTYLRNRFAVATLKARYQRLVHERLLELTETCSHSVTEDPGHWQQLGAEGRGLTPEASADLRTRAREFVQSHPHARHILRLMEAYVAGPELSLTARLIPSTSEARLALRSMHEHSDPDAQRLLDAANNWWKQFIERNHRHYSFREHARRTWRDGEAFLRLFLEQQGPPSVRFIDPEWIGPTRESPDSQGIVTEPHDAESPVAYLRIDPETGDLAEAIPSGEVLHTRIGADSNEKRGVSLFAPLLDTLDSYSKWMQTELLARKLQASIVLWRKVQGSPSEALRMSEASATGEAVGGGRRERFQPGTILTTNHSTEVQFLQPKTNFSDAAPLGRMLLLSVAAGAGLPATTPRRWWLRVQR